MWIINVWNLHPPSLDKMKIYKMFGVNDWSIHYETLNLLNCIATFIHVENTGKNNNSSNRNVKEESEKWFSRYVNVMY